MVAVSKRHLNTTTFHEGGWETGSLFVFLHPIVLFNDHHLTDFPLSTFYLEDFSESSNTHFTLFIKCLSPSMSYSVRLLFFLISA